MGSAGTGPRPGTAISTQFARRSARPRGRASPRSALAVSAPSSTRWRGRTKRYVAQQERKTERDFALGWPAVARGAPRNKRREQGLAPVQGDAREHAVQIAARRPGEGASTPVVLRTRRVADQHEPGLRVAVREHEVHGRIAQSTALRGDERGTQLLDGASILGGHLRAGGRRAGWRGRGSRILGGPGTPAGSGRSGEGARRISPTGSSAKASSAPHSICSRSSGHGVHSGHSCPQ